jgi:hypothetical protein
MSGPIPPVRVTVEQGSRLDELLSAYADVKPRADEAVERLKAVTDAIKAELGAAAPGAPQVDVSHPALPQTLRLSYAERWDLDTKRLKAEQPALYVEYARQGGRWELRGVRS